MTKQVKIAAAPEVAVVQNSTTPQNLFVSVKTFNEEGRTVGERIVDMCHYNTTNWLSKHLWWSTHHGYCTEVDIAKPAEIEAYLEAGKAALAEKFNANNTAEVLTEAKAA